MILYRAEAIVKDSFAPDYFHSREELIMFHSHYKFVNLFRSRKKMKQQ